MMFAVENLRSNGEACEKAHSYYHRTLTNSHNAKEKKSGINNNERFFEIHIE